MKEGIPVDVGDTIGVFAPGVETSGGCVGLFTVEVAGGYGDVEVYGDNLQTTEKDGAYPGDPLIFLLCTDSGRYVANEIGEWTTDGYTEMLDLHFDMPFGGKGDLEPDGDIDLFDVLRAVDIVLDVPPLPNPYEQWAGDMEDDLDIDLFDILAIIDIVLQT